MAEESAAAIWRRGRPVQILPGCLMQNRESLSGTRSVGLGVPASPEPDGPPPLPTELFKIAVVGDRGVGKSSAARRFARREYCEPFPPECSAIGSANAVVAAGTSMPFGAKAKADGRRSRAGKGLTAEYYKKDVALWNISAESCDGGGELEGEVGTRPGLTVGFRQGDIACVRVQIWDLSFDDDSAARGWRQGDECHRILRGATGIVIVCSYSDEEGGVEGIRRAVSKWIGRVHALPGLEARRWVGRDPQLTTRRTPHVVLLVNKSDEIYSSMGASTSSAAQWMTIGSEIERIAKANGISDWFLGTCSSQALDTFLEESNVEHAFLSIIRSHLRLKRKQKEEKSNHSTDHGVVPGLVSPDSSYSDSPSSID